VKAGRECRGRRKPRARARASGDPRLWHRLHHQSRFTHLVSYLASRIHLRARTSHCIDTPRDTFQRLARQSHLENAARRIVSASYHNDDESRARPLSTRRWDPERPATSYTEPVHRTGTLRRPASAQSNRVVLYVASTSTRCISPRARRTALQGWTQLRLTGRYIAHSTHRAFRICISSAHHLTLVDVDRHGIIPFTARSTATLQLGRCRNDISHGHLAARRRPFPPARSAPLDPCYEPTAGRYQRRRAARFARNCPAPIE
jgi:hypothetical protein